MDITVILCTYNRANELAEALQSAAGLALPQPVEYEVLIVDNNSTDQTREVVAEFCRRYPGRFRYLFESRQGLCHARNAGVHEAEGEIVAFMDDDVKVGANWLHELTRTLYDGGYAGAGGRILPDRVFSIPAWLPLANRYSLAPFAIFDLGPEAGLLAEPPFGANMAFRKDIFERYGAFRIDLGRSGTDLLSNEDTEFGLRLLKAGERLRYEPSAVAYHPIDENRLRKEYFLAWWFGKGRSDARQFENWRGDKYLCRGVPLKVLRDLGVATARWIVAPDSRVRFSRKLQVWNKAGQILECYRQARAARSRTMRNRFQFWRSRSHDV